MAEILWTPAGKAEVRAMGPRLRKADKREMEAIHGEGVDPADGLENALALSRIAYVGRDAEDPTSDPFVLYGVADDVTNEGYGAIWLVATNGIHPFRKALLRDAPDRIRYIHEKGWYPRGLHNLVDARNKTHLKWLKQMGAEFPHIGKVALINKVPFLYFRFIPCVTPFPLSLVQA